MGGAVSYFVCVSGLVGVIEAPVVVVMKKEAVEKKSLLKLLNRKSQEILLRHLKYLCSAPLSLSSSFSSNFVSCTLLLTIIYHFITSQNLYHVMNILLCVIIAIRSREAGGMWREEHTKIMECTISGVSCGYWLSGYKLHIDAEEKWLNLHL